MIRECLPGAVLRVASLLAPAPLRAGWLREWRSELFYVPPAEAAGFSAGAFRDALWLRRNTPGPPWTVRAGIESPIRCLAALTALALASGWVAMRLITPDLMGHGIRLTPRDSLAMLLLTALLFPATRLAMGSDAADRIATPWKGRLRLGVFLAVKLALVQPVMFCGFVLLILAGRVLPAVSQIGLSAMWILTFRWVILDQRRRCPVCLRLLTDPVRIGAPSNTLLAWYGSESACSRGHGLLQVSASPPSCSEAQRWYRLDPSWRALFAPATGGRRS